MTDRERILRTVTGKSVDRVPWIPRLEFWHRARLRNGTLPPELRGLSLMEIADHLGVGFYSVVPDFTERSSEEDMLDRPLGICNLASLPYRVTLRGVDRRVDRHGHETVIEYHTPAGSIRTSAIFTEEMLDGGSSISWITGHAIREPLDFEVVGYIFSHLKVEPRPDGYLARRRQIGDRGIAVAFTSGSACPMQHIMKELMTIEQFFYAMHDCPEAVEKLAEQMQPFYRGIQECAAETPAEVVMLGGNYDDAITYPPFFRKHILPALREYASTLHGKGKLLMTHTDGENRKLLPLYREAGFDIADSVCPYPMTSCTLEELREAFAGRITIWGGIPSVLLCRESASEEQFRRFVGDLLGRYGRETRFVLGVSDMVTADCEWDRMRYISERVASIG
jgi:uroporphyrinogen-III decarboxylase